MNPLIQGHFGTTPEMSRNAFSAEQETKEDDPQSDPHPEAGIFGNQTMRDSGKEECRDSIFMTENIKGDECRIFNEIKKTYIECNPESEAFYFFLCCVQLKLEKIWKT